MIFLEYVDSRACLSAESTGKIEQKRTKAYKSTICRLFIANFIPIVLL